MRRFLLAISALAILMAGATPARSEPLPKDEDLFKWGEYDSLIRVLEPSTRNETKVRTLADSLERAKSFLFLGVAFYATGKKSRAEDAFMRAVELDPQVKLDRFYVTEEIANHFQAIALDGLRKRAAVKVTPDTVRTRSAPQPVLVPRKSRKWWWWGAGVAAAAVAGGGYFLLTPEKAPDNVTKIDLTK